MLQTPGTIHVGERLRQLRVDHGLSVRTLAMKAGFSPGFISQVEHSQVSPSIASLDRLATALGVSLGRFFAEPPASPSVVVRASARQELGSAWSRATIEALGPTDGTRMLEPLMITLAPGGRSGTGLHAAQREHFALVCHGEATLVLSEATHTLVRGDAVSIAADTLHQWINASPETIRVLIVSALGGV